VHVALFLLAAWIAVGATPLVGQRSEGEARGIVGSIAGTIYNLAWPTAQYEDFTLGELRRVDNGWDVPIVLYGKSAFSGGPLWLELVLELRNGSLYDIRLGRDNHILAPPFATLATTAAIVAAVIESESQQQGQVAQGNPQRTTFTPTPAPDPAAAAEEHDRRDAQMLVGTWQDQNSMFTYYADGRLYCEWTSGERMYGYWSIHSDTLTLRSDDGHRALYVLEALGPYEHRTRSVNDGSVWVARRISY
jgi:hypothetical protein